MQWRKLGVVWSPDGKLPWAQRYATCPTPIVLPDGNIRIYIQCRDRDGIGRVGFVDVARHNPLSVIRVAPSPVLDVGEPGSFDDNGVFQTCVMQGADGYLRMYYAGFEICNRIRYRLLTGVAVSEDGGKTFKRWKNTPILERSPTETSFRGGPFVMRGANGEYRMWYVAGSAWEDIDGKAMPVYDIRYMESPDGFHWPETGMCVIPLDVATEHGLGRPYVVNKGDTYQMFFSVRKRLPRAYRMGYAESSDGVRWQRCDSQMGLDVSSSGWDSEAIEYAAVLEIDGRTFCFYNGNEFGVTGFGVAELVA
jgi:predicted GH43/DUF377 family glycosyl hydrolase